MMLTAKSWKDFYRREREALGADGLARVFDRSPKVSGNVSSRRAMIFPHTRLSASGHLTAAAALAAVESGCDEVLALGVLHGGREQDAALVKSARAGDKSAVEQLRRIHGPGAANDQQRWSDEFSLDNFAVFLDLAAKRAGKRVPHLIARYPFLTGELPQSLPGMDELHAIVNRGAFIVATTDPVHHGAGYDTPETQRLPRESDSTRTTARRWIEEAFAALSRHDYRAFLANAQAVRSDFRDVGPVLAELLQPGNLKFAISDLVLVDYADVLESAEPTWVAAALASAVMS